MPRATFSCGALGAVVLAPLSAVVPAGASTAAPAIEAAAAASRHAVAAASPLAVAAELSKARQAIAQRTTVRLEGTLSERLAGVGVAVEVEVDAGARYGKLSESIASGGRRVRLGALLTPTTGYCTGDPDALTAGCGLDAAQAYAARGHWVAVPAAGASYGAIAGSVLYGDQLAGLVPASGTSFTVAGDSSSILALHSSQIGPSSAERSTASAASSAVIVLRGPAEPAAGFPPGTVETLELAASGPALPVAASFASPGRVSASEWFSRWGARFSVSPPRRSLRLGSLR